MRVEGKCRNEGIKGKSHYQLHRVSNPATYSIFFLLFLSFLFLSFRCEVDFEDAQSNPKTNINKDQKSDKNPMTTTTKSET